MFMVLSSWPKSLREFTQFIWWIQTERWVTANAQTKPINLRCESAETWLLPPTPTIAIVIITQPVSWYSFYRPTEDLGTAVKVAAHAQGCILQWLSR